MHSFLAKSVLLALLLASHGATAETLKIPLGQQGSQQAQNLPRHGQSQASVLRNHGEPLKRHASVGQPPITRWDYPAFSVYFEYSHVVDSVYRHHGRQP